MEIILRADLANERRRGPRWSRQPFPFDWVNVTSVMVGGGDLTL